jgi:hypothetical protein
LWSVFSAFNLCPKTCHRFSYTLVCRVDPFARFRAVRTISSSGCWYCLAVLASAVLLSGTKMIRFFQSRFSVAHAIRLSLVPHSGVPRNDDDIAKQLEGTRLLTAGACGHQQPLFSIRPEPPTMFPQQLKFWNFPGRFHSSAF